MCVRKENEAFAIYCLRFLVEHTAEAFIAVALLATYFVYQDFKALSASQIEVNTQILLEMQNINNRLEHLEQNYENRP